VSEIKNSIGVMVSSLSHSQLSFYSIRKGNEYLKENPLGSYTIFFANLSKPVIVPCFALLNLVEAYSFNGITVATCPETAIKLLGMPGNKRKIFYSFDLYWIRQPRLPFESLQYIYGNPHMELFARSESHRKIMENCWNRPVKVSEDFDLAEFNK
jgi:hypothetical protein